MNSVMGDIFEKARDSVTLENGQLMDVIRMPGDGNCFYCALYHAILVHNTTHENKIDLPATDYLDLKTKIIEEIRKNKSKINDFDTLEEYTIREPHSQNPDYKTFNNIDEYLEYAYIAYASTINLKCASNLLGVRIFLQNNSHNGTYKVIFNEEQNLPMVYVTRGGKSVESMHYNLLVAPGTWNAIQDSKELKLSKLLYELGQVEIDLYGVETLPEELKDNNSEARISELKAQKNSLSNQIATLKGNTLKAEATRSVSDSIYIKFGESRYDEAFFTQLANELYHEINSNSYNEAGLLQVFKNNGVELDLSENGNYVEKFNKKIKSIREEIEDKNSDKFITRVIAVIKSFFIKIFKGSNAKRIDKALKSLHENLNKAPKNPKPQL